MNPTCRLVCSKCDPCFSHIHVAVSSHSCGLRSSKMTARRNLQNIHRKNYDSCMIKKKGKQKRDSLNALTFGLIDCKTANRCFGTVGSKRFLVLTKCVKIMLPLLDGVTVHLGWFLFWHENAWLLYNIKLTCKETLLRKYPS